MSLTRLDKITLKYFNAVYVDTIKIVDSIKYVPEGIRQGFAIPSEIEYIYQDIIDNFSINQTFFASWKVVEEMMPVERATHQILHYLTSYGKLLGDYVYIPTKIENYPTIKLQVIKVINEDTLINKSLELINSGLSLSKELQKDLIFILLTFKFSKMGELTSNREFVVRLYDELHLYPKDPVLFLSLLIFKCVKYPLIIKSPETICGIEVSNMDLSKDVKNIQLSSLATIFYRMKNLFLAFRRAHSNNKPWVNKVRRLAVKHHVPFVEDKITRIRTLSLDELRGILPKYSIFKLCTILQSLAITSQNRVYNIRNGKVFIKETPKTQEMEVDNVVDDSQSQQDDVMEFENIPDTGKLQALEIEKLNLIKSYIIKKIKPQNVKFPDNIDYGLPCSDKMFCGNVPMYTSYYFEKDESALLGINWDTDNDLDLFVANSTSHCGWDSKFVAVGITYSGDMTRANSSEFMKITSEIKEPSLLYINNFSGSMNNKVEIIIAKDADDVTMTPNYTVNPTSVITRFTTEMITKDHLIGAIVPTSSGVVFTLLNRACAKYDNKKLRSMLIDNFKTRQPLINITLKDMMIIGGCRVLKHDSTEECSDFRCPEKTSFVNIF